MNKDKVDKKYFILTKDTELVFLGEFSNFSEAWDFAEYENPRSFVWIFKEENLQKLQNQIMRLHS